jgi:SAM-dependent methyltransferase
MLETRNLTMVPSEAHRRGGKLAYGEWCYVIGIFQTLIGQHIGEITAPTIVDIGCGTGLLAIAAQPYLQRGGHYTGIDVSQRDIEFCRKHYSDSPFTFQHLETHNPSYAPQQERKQAALEIPDNSADMVTALSVWTHLNEVDALFYMREVARVLKPGATAIITMFVLDALYEQTKQARSTQRSPLYPRPENMWLFETPVSASGQWRSPAWVDVPEDAVGVTTEALSALKQASGLDQTIQYSGSWKGQAGLYLQDILIFKKSAVS